MLKSYPIIGASALFLLLGISAPANAWQGKSGKQQGNDNPAQQQQQRPQQQRAPQQQQQRPQQQRAPQQQQQRPQRQARAPQQQQQRPQQQARGQQRQQRPQQGNRSAQQRSPAQERQQRGAWQGDRARNWKSDHRTWQQRGGYNGYRIPDNRFRSYFGQDHGFRMYGLPVMFVGGHRRFRYGGFWFGLVDPWPEYWASDWYNSDDVYVDYYGDGYYLYNRRYPGDRIAISFYLN